MTMADTKKSFDDAPEPSASAADRETQPAYSATDPVLEAVVVGSSPAANQGNDSATTVTPALVPAPPGAAPIQAASVPPPPSQPQQQQHQAYQYESAPLVAGGLPRYNSVSTPTRRALARFLEAFAYAAFFCIVTSGEIRKHIHKGHHHRNGDWDWDDDDGWWWFLLPMISPSGA
ncbi:hypothetical protein OC861_002086 [Tilletia horrida]|nr:hypothetical protein OC861_002086 [Tilletia horrida]